MTDAVTGSTGTIVFAGATGLIGGLTVPRLLALAEIDRSELLTALGADAAR